MLTGSERKRFGHLYKDSLNEQVLGSDTSGFNSLLYVLISSVYIQSAGVEVASQT